MRALNFRSVVQRDQPVERKKTHRHMDTTENARVNNDDDACTRSAIDMLLWDWHAD